MILLPARPKAEYYAIHDEQGNIVSDGVVEPHLFIHGKSSITLMHDPDENVFLSKVNQVGVVSTPLPEMGQLVEAKKVYAWNGQNVIARQEHTRTEHDPDTVPALFSVYREAYDGIEWIANEPVLVGNQRKHNDIMYEVITAHTTEFSPDLAPALWNVVTSGEWPDWTQPLGAHDAYPKGAKVTHNQSKWISQYANNAWVPGVFGWLEA